MHFILFILTTCVLICCWCFIVHQLCITSFNNKQQLKRSLFAFFFCTISLFMIAIYYVSSWYPKHVVFADFKMVDLRKAFEGIYVLIGSHIYRSYLTWLYDKLYRPMERQYPRPSCIKYTPIIIQCVVIIFALPCYICDIVFDNITFIYLFYIILYAIILTVLIILICTWAKVLRFARIFENMEDNSRISEEQKDNIDKWLIFAKGAMYVAVLLVLSDLVVVFIALDDFEVANIKFDFLIPFSYDKVLMGNIGYSTFIFILNMLLMVWSYKKSKCCIIDKDSVCSLLECATCCDRGISGCELSDENLVNLNQDVNSIPLPDTTSDSLRRTISPYITTVSNNIGNNAKYNRMGNSSPLATMPTSKFDQVNAK
eukprot:401043_1